MFPLRALLTIRRQRWLTRLVAVENGQVIHADAAPTDAALTDAVPTDAAPADVT